MQNFKTTADVKVPEKLIDQVIGQRAATEIVKKAARQRRNTLLVGSPGTGKTMLAQAMAELLPATELEDVLAYKNSNDENMPLIKTVKTYPNEEARNKGGDGQGRQTLQKERMKSRMTMGRGASAVTPIILMLVIVLFALSLSGFITGYEIIVLAALILGILIFGGMVMFMSGVTRRAGILGTTDTNEPKLIVDNTGYKHAPFIDATGSRAGALFGDVRHDPLQCIPTGEAVLLANGKPVSIEVLVDPYFAEKSEGEVNANVDTRILGGVDNKFKFAPADITKVYRRSYSGKVICVKTRDGSKIRVTPNHPIATIASTGDVIYVEAGEVQVGSRIISKERVQSGYSTLDHRVEHGKTLAMIMLAKLVGRSLSEDAYAFDQIVEIKSEDYNGFVYNLTTKTGNYLVDSVLTHNTGGLGTPAHLRVESGAVHKANKGVLFIDEVSRLEPKSQQDLLTSLQEKKYPITGQSEMSSGALVKTEPVPADFILVAAGNLQDIQAMHPALRSRIRGYGYELYMESTMEDNDANRTSLVQFIAQEVRKDGKIPHFDKGAVEEILEEARRRSGRKKRLTLILRDLGGLIRAAGDIAVEKKQKVVTKEDVVAAKGLANSVEAQVVAQEIEYTKDYRVFGTRGFSIGKVNGLAVMGTSAITSAGIVLPIVAEVTPASSRSEGKFIPTGKLGKIANEAVKNVSAIIKKHIGRDVANYDMHVQFLQSYAGVEGDSASISVAISIISAMENMPVDQSVAMTGSLSVRGEVLPVGGVTSKVEAAISAGMRRVIIPQSNKDDIYISRDRLRKIKVIPVRTLADVIRYSIKQSKRKNEIIAELKKHEQSNGK